VTARARELVKGEKVRLIPDGQLYEVARVSPCAGYLFKVYDPPMAKVIGDAQERDDAIGVLQVKMERLSTEPDEAYRAAVRAAHAVHAVRTILVSRGPIEPGISSTAFVYRDES
jgi:hypothetical protein